MGLLKGATHPKNPSYPKLLTLMFLENLGSWLVFNLHLVAIQAPRECSSRYAQPCYILFNWNMAPKVTSLPKPNVAAMEVDKMLLD